MPGNTVRNKCTGKGKACAQLCVCLSPPRLSTVCEQFANSLIMGASEHEKKFADSGIMTILSMNGIESVRANDSLDGECESNSKQRETKLGLSSVFQLFAMAFEICEGKTIMVIRDALDVDKKSWDDKNNEILKLLVTYLYSGKNRSEDDHPRSSHCREVFRH